MNNENDKDRKIIPFAEVAKKLLEAPPKPRKKKKKKMREGDGSNK